MITLNVDDCCHNCPNFEPDVLVEEISCSYQSIPIFNTEIFCKKREGCISICFGTYKKETNK